MGLAEIAILTGIIGWMAIMTAWMVQPDSPKGPYDGCTVRTNQTHIIQLEGSATCGALIDDLTEKGWRLHTYTDPYPFLARPQYVLVYPLSPSSTTTAASSDVTVNVNATVDTLPLRCSGKGCPLPPSSDD